MSEKEITIKVSEDKINSIIEVKESFLKSIRKKKMRMFPWEKFSEYTSPEIIEQTALLKKRIDDLQKAVDVLQEIEDRFNYETGE